MSHFIERLPVKQSGAPFVCERLSIIGSYR